MCGLVGIIGNITAKEETLFEEMLYADVLRGPHSTGMIAGHGADGFSTWKKALKSADFLELQETADTIRSATSCLIGHNRYATLGAKTSRNAHPFDHGEIALVHNGTLTNKASLTKGATVFPTDSETIAYRLSQDDPKEVLEELLGAYALIWVDTDGVVHIAKNDERDLHWFRIKRFQQENIVVCSEADMGTWLINRNSYEVLSQGAVPVGKIISIGTDLSHAVVDFTPRVPKVSKGWNTTNNYQQKKGENVTFTIEESIGNEHVGTVTSGAAPIGYEVQVYGSVQATVNITVGNSYTAQIASISAKDEKVYLRQYSMYAKNGNKLPVVIEHGGADYTKPVDCNWCTAEITVEELNAGEYSALGNAKIHLECDQLYASSLDY